MKAKIIMLPTENETMVLRNTYCFTEAHGNPLKYGRIRNAVERGFEYQHLYVITNEEIKEDDWYVNDKMIFKADSVFDNGNNPNQNKLNKKIAATTNKLYNNIGGKLLTQKLPTFSQEFLKQYCEAGGIDEVEIETENYYDEPDDSIHSNRGEFKNRIKINPDNTINIKPIKLVGIEKKLKHYVMTYLMNLLKTIYQKELLNLMVLIGLKKI